MRGLASTAASVVLLAALSCQGSSGAAPALTSLELDGLPLSPPFAPSVHDYAVRCLGGENATRIAATAPAGVALTMLRPEVLPLATPAMGTLLENQAVVVQARAEDGATSEYWVRCLPHDFPRLSMVRHASTTPGYYVTGNATFGNGDSGYAMVLDGNATPLWYRAAPPGYSAAYVGVVAKNTIAMMSDHGEHFGIDPSGQFDVLDLETSAATSVKAVGSATDGHELLRLANGDWMLLSYPATPGFDLASRGITGTQTIADCNIQEIAPDGSLVWSWLGSDHFDAATESTELAPASINGTNVVDPFHCNSLDVDADGNVLLSARQMDAVVLVSRKTGKVLWKLGGVPSNKDGAQILRMAGDPAAAFYHQHDARLRPGDHITLFDDHTTMNDSQMPPARVARGMEFALDFAAGTGTVVFEVDGAASTAATGSFRRLDDGSSVVGWGFLGMTAPAPAMTQVDASGHPLLELAFVDGDHAYRVLEVPTTSLDLDVMRRTAGLP